METETAAGAADIADTLGHLHQVLRRAAIQRGGRPKLPDAQIEVLRLVERNPGVSVKEAAELLHVAPNTVSTLIGGLAAAGLLERTREEKNRRMVRLELTPQARERIDAYAAHRRELLAGALDRLDEAARRDLLRAVPHLRQLVDLISGQVPEARPVDHTTA